MEIRVSNDVPDSTYFRTGDVEPEISDNALTVYDGNGSRRGWGTPGVTSTVVVDAPDFVAVHVGFHHKHGGGQFWRFYNVNGKIEQVSWTKLDDEIRQIVLDAYDENAPQWARVPGKLRRDCIKPAPRKFLAFKIVELANEMQSLYDGTTYELGKTKIEKARRNHNGGYYVYTGSDVIERFRAGEIANRKEGQYALLECECWGNREYYDASGDCITWWVEHEGWSCHKIAVTYCKPVKIVDTFEI